MSQLASSDFKTPAMAIQTLNELNQLRLSRFGRPKPRHGLRLLFWFAHEFIEFNSNEMVATSQPHYGVFGFHPFHNWADDGDQLLPPQSFDYYEVGNLNEANSLNFPAYVREDHTGWQDDSNTDRIIVDMDGWNVDRVYVTCHSDLLNFSRSDTYRISHGLINIIRRMSLERFLSEMDPPKMQMQSADRTNVPIRNDSVKIVVVVVFMLFALWIWCQAVW